MIYTVLKSTYTKLEPNVSCKGQHKNFSKESFLKDLKLGLIITIFLTILIMSLKKNYIIIQLQNGQNKRKRRSETLQHST